jgi:hypothetical protein
VALNFSGEQQRLTLPDGISLSGLMLSTDPGPTRGPDGDWLVLGSNEGMILSLAQEDL